MPDAKFLQLLKQKLTIGNRRAVHLNVLPNRQLNRADAKDMEILHPELPNKFLKTLLTRSKFTFHFDYQHPDKKIAELDEDEQKVLQILNKRLNFITYSNNDYYLEHGVKPFAFGYPILLKKDRQDPTKIIKAPVLIWYLDIEKSSTKAYKWTIRRAEDYPVYFNQLLISHIENDEGITLQNLSDEYLSDSILEESEVVEICNRLLQQLGAEEEHLHTILTPCPGAHTIKHVEVTKPTIRWAGVFGLFKTQKQPIIKDIEYIARHAAEFRYDKLIFSPYQNTPYAAVKTDPSQQAILNSMNKFPNKIIQGPPGTGKSQSLTAIITNALENGAKCLIVCEKRTALEVIQNNLNQLGLKDLNVIIEDISKDRKRVVDSVRDRIAQGFETPPFKEYAYQDKVLKADKAAKKINEGHQFLNKKLLGTANWTDMVGHFLQSEQTQSKAILEPHLDTSIFEFTDKEYHQIKESIARGQQLYAQIGSLDHPLNGINHRWYVNNNPGELLFAIRSYTEKMWLEADTIHQKLHEVRTAYAELLCKEYENYSDRLLAAIEQLQQTISENFTQYKNAFNEPSGIQKLIVSAFSFLSNKHKTIQEEQEKIRHQYRSLRKSYERRPYFAHKFVAVGEKSSYTFNTIAANLNHLKKAVETWISQQDAIIKGYANSLNVNNIHPNIDFETEIQTTQAIYLQFIAKANEMDLLNYHVVENLTSFGGMMLTLELLKENLEKILSHLDEFKEFYDWKHFFIHLPATAKSILVALIEQKSQNWGMAFQSWYYHWLLARNESTATPTEDSDIHAYAYNLNEIHQLQTNKTLHYWTAEQQLSVYEFNKNYGRGSMKRLYNKRGSKGKKRNSLRKIIKADFKVFSDFFPVLLVSPVVCSSIVPLKEGLFEVVIFDEASQLRLEDTFAALLRGKHKIVSGDIHQMPPTTYFGMANHLLIDESEEDEDEWQPNDTDLATKESLLEYAEDSGYQHSFLDFHYRSRHPQLIDFSNAAFYGSRLVPMPAQKTEKPIRFFPVNGIYHKHVNEAEAAKILDILLDDICGNMSIAAQTIEEPIEPPSSSTVFEPIAAPLTIMDIRNQSRERYLQETEQEQEQAAASQVFKKKKPASAFESLPSVGIATFNIYQRNLILEKIQARKLADPIAAYKLNALEYKGLFVKNLENIQGDERDIVLISTTFGIREDGRFLQNFGPINQKKGYQLLNVIITRAKQQIYVCTSIPSTYFQGYAEAIRLKGITGKSCLYAYLAYAQAIENEREESRQSILQLLREHCVENNRHNRQALLPSPFIEIVAQKLSEHIDPKRIQIHYNCGGFLIDVAIFPLDHHQPIIALECDGSKQHDSSEAYVHDLYRQEQLSHLGFKFHRIYSANWWLNIEKSVKNLLAVIRQNG